MGLMLDLATAPARAALALLNALPGEDSPHLVKLRDAINGAVARPPLGSQLSPAAVAGGGASSTSNSRSLGITYSPQITVGAGGDAAGVRQAVRAGSDDLVERLQRAEEQERRLSYAQ